MKRIAIVGAGIAGLAASLRLARTGDFSVEVFEQAEGPGGKLSAFEEQGFRFDAGPSLFTLPHLVDELVDLCSPTSTPFVYRKLDRSCHYFWEDGTRFIAWADKQALAAEVHKCFGVDPTPFLRRLEHSEFLFNTTASLFMERSLHRAASYLSKDVLKALVNVFKLDLGTSMHASNNQALNHPKLVQLFDRFATYNGSDPYRAPGVLNIIPHLEHNIGTFFPEGGMYSITETLVALAEEAGVVFHYKCPVKEILRNNNQVCGLRTEKGMVEADLVISNADVFTTYKHLMPEVTPPRKILERERSSSALIFYWGINKTFDVLHLHNILFSDDYREEFRLIRDGKRISDDPTVYINITSKCEPSDAPEGCENWFVMVNVPANTDQNWDALIPQIRASVIAKINRMLNTDIEGSLVSESVLDPRLIESKTSSHMGALYGTASNDRMAAFLRHPNFSSKLKGLYFCGGSVHPGGGIPLCLLSAKIVSEIIDHQHG